MLFSIKSGFLSKNTFSFASDNEGLTYSTATIGGLVSRDSDGDGIPDWEENLWGTDPLKRETTPGIPDSSVINKLKAEQGGYSLEGEYESGDLTETDKFSRELFSTIVSLSQAGSMDQATVDKISSSLAEQIKNSEPRKVYEISDIKITKDESVASVRKYNNAMDNINTRYPAKGNVVEILQKFIIDEDNVNVGALAELDFIINPTQNRLEAILEIEVPQSLVSLHLDFINKIEIFKENLEDIKLFETDPLISLGAISQFEKNITLLESSIMKLKNSIEEKLNS